MINMMTDLLYYLPYFLIVGAAFLLVSAGGIFSVKHLNNPRNTVVKRQKL
ncbi:MAG: hypothetical protein LH472_06775 [Pyrinomonadaceae bacterium]|nr:hypothetical protein [Pyrinomonadaceae bacterium]